MNNFIEAMIQGHEYSEYRWLSAKFAEFCGEYDFLNNQIRPTQVWLAKGLPHA